MCIRRVQHTSQVCSFAFPMFTSREGQKAEFVSLSLDSTVEALIGFSMHLLIDFFEFLNEALNRSGTEM